MARERVRFAQKIGALTRAEQCAGELRGILNATKITRLRALELGMDAQEAANLHEHLVRVDEAIDHADGDVNKAKVVVDKGRKELVEKRRDERAIELYRERRLKVWTRDFHRDETRTLDDIGTIRHVRQTSNENE
jgi:flagellar export protein FliJ